MISNKIILDACCGSRAFWFDKTNPNTIFQDIRELESELPAKRRLSIHPDNICDCRHTNFPDKTFKLVVFDPPHLKHGTSGIMAEKYATLPEDWRAFLKDSVNELMRVLDDYGILIFKWSEVSLKVSEIISALDYQPLFGHVARRGKSTVWLCFMKIPQH